MSFQNIWKSILNPRVRIKGLNSASPEGGDGGERPQGSRRKRLLNLPLVLGAVILLFLFFVMLFGPLFVDHNPYLTAIAFDHVKQEGFRNPRPPFDPSPKYLLGTDKWGNDLLSLLVYGSRVTVVAALYISLARLGLGIILGSIAGWNASRLGDRLIMTLSGTITSIPILLSSMIIILVLGVENGLIVFLIALTATGWTEVAEHVRGQVVQIREKAYMEGARAVGLTPVQTLVRHVLPNLLPHLIVITFLDLGAVLLLIAELGFLGFFIGGGSVYDPDPVFGARDFILVEVPEWGGYLAQGVPFIRSSPHLVVVPSLAFSLAILGFNAFGEGLRRFLDQNAISTAFLLKKRALVYAAVVILVTAFIFEYTGPKQSFTAVAAQMDRERASVEATNITDRARNGEPVEAAGYIADQIKAAGFHPGLRLEMTSRYTALMQTQVFALDAPPVLEVLGAGGQTRLSFEPEIDFTYQLRGMAGEGQVELPLTFVDMRPQPRSILGWSIGSLLKGLRVEGHVVMVRDTGLHTPIIDGLINAGAAGLLVIDTTGEELPASESVVTGLADQPAGKEVPIFHIRPSVAEAVLSEAGLALAELQLDPQSDDLSEQWWPELRIRMALELEEIENRVHPAVFGFKAGYDAKISQEIVVIATAIDLTGSGTPEDISMKTARGASLLLEMARSHEEAWVDPRRSLVLIAWGSGDIHDPGLEEFIANPENFARLPVATSSSGAPSVVVMIDPNGNPTPETVVYSPAESKLLALFEDSARTADLSVRVKPSPTGERRSREERLETILVQLPDPEGELSTQEQVEAAGKALSLTVLELIRQLQY